MGLFGSQSTTLTPTGQTQLGSDAGRIQNDQLLQMEEAVNRGPGQQDITTGYNATKSFADMLNQYSQSGGLPTGADMATGNQYAQSMFAPQQLALQQSFTQQNTDMQRMAAQLGRSADDPILQNKLRTGFMNQQGILNADQSAYGNQLAMALPGQRLNYAQQRTSVLGNLATQAMQNRSALLGIGNQMQGAERQFRIQTGTQTTEKDPGAMDYLSAGLAAAGQGIQLYSMFGAGGLGAPGASAASPAMAAPMASSAAAAGNVGFQNMNSTLSPSSGFGGVGNTQGYGFNSYQPRTYSLGASY